MSHIHLDIDQGIARLALARPELHNAFDDALIAELTSTLEELASRDDLRALVLTGQGSSFSAGADLNWMRRMAGASEAENRDDALRLAALMRSLRQMPLPTIARVNGHAFGGGVGLVACCDIAICADRALFGLTETRLGLVPAAISPHVIDAIGARQASRWFLTGERFDAAQALAMGLVHRIVPAAELDAAIDEQIAHLRACGPVAVRQAKALVRRLSGSDAGSDDHTIDADNAALIARLRVSPEGQEGLSAFLDKRTPDWA